MRHIEEQGHDSRDDTCDNEAAPEVGICLVPYIVAAQSGTCPEAIDYVPRDPAQDQRDCKKSEEESAAKYRNEPFFENAHLAGPLPLPVILLYRLDAYLLFLQALNRIDDSPGPGDRGRVRHPVLEGAPPD